MLCGIVLCVFVSTKSKQKPISRMAAATRFISLRAHSDHGAAVGRPNNGGATVRCCMQQSRKPHELNGVGSGSRHKPAVAVKAAVTETASENAIVTTAKQETTDESAAGFIDLGYLQENAVSYVFLVFKVVTKRRPWKLTAQMLIERGVVDCRFFTLFGVMGCLVGSILCFIEGCFFVIESYLQYFKTISQSSSDHHGDVMHLLIEALDMYLIGTALLAFGMGMHVMFVASNNPLKGKATSHHHLRSSNLFGLFSLEKLPGWVGMQSVGQAKSKIGHAVMMMMQVGLLDKFKTVPMVTGLDLACFAAALFVSSACIFILSRLSFQHK